MSAGACPKCPARGATFPGESMELCLRQIDLRSREERSSIAGTAGQNEEWQHAQSAMSLALCTTMRGCEIKRLQWRDVDFLSRAILVRTSKTEAGERLIPMNDEAYEMVMRLRERAKGFNGIAPQHYVFPACEHGHCRSHTEPT
jgi:integrase